MILKRRLKIYYENEMGKLYFGNNLFVLRRLKENSVDSIVTDPPYGLRFMGKKWDYDVPGVEIWKECLRVLKPGGFLLSFAGTRTQHRMAVNIEDAGFEIRDMIAWVYGCLSEDTEILTINGWKRYYKDIDKYSVLCYDIETNKFEFQKPLGKTQYENKHIAYRIQSNYTDQIVSRNHNCVIERNGRKVFCRSEALEQQENLPFLESLSELPETIYDSESGTSIKKQILQELCRKGDIKIKKRKDCSNRKEKGEIYTLWCLWKRSVEIFSLVKKDQTSNLLKQVQRLFKRARVEKSCPQRKIKLELEIGTSIKRTNDRGNKSCLERWSNLFQKKRKLFTDKICQMSTRIFGNVSKKRLCYGTSFNNSSIIGKSFKENRSSASYQSQSARQSYQQSSVIFNQSSSQTIRSTRATVTPIKYKEKVWCVEVPFGAFVARRKGKIFITGNSGFPKSLNIGKAVDKLEGNERRVVGSGNTHRTAGGIFVSDDEGVREHTKGTSPHEGWGIALKPALEPITVARKPMSEGTVAKNVLKWGTGGINIDGSRVGVDKDDKNHRDMKNKKVHTTTFANNGKARSDKERNDGSQIDPQGRFPSNFIHDGSDEVLGLFPSPHGAGEKRDSIRNCNSKGLFSMPGDGHRFGDNGSAARFFYCAKASKAERNRGLIDNKNNHPTVKPIVLMEYLVRLVTPPGGTVLDPFLGSGTTAIACQRLDKKWIGIEDKEEYCEIASKRISNDIEKAGLFRNLG